MGIGAIFIPHSVDIASHMAKLAKFAKCAKFESPKSISSSLFLPSPSYSLSPSQQGGTRYNTVNKPYAPILGIFSGISQSSGQYWLGMVFVDTLFPLPRDNICWYTNPQIEESHCFHHPHHMPHQHWSFPEHHHYHEQASATRIKSIWPPCLTRLLFLRQVLQRSAESSASKVDSAIYATKQCNPPNSAIQGSKLHHCAYCSAPQSTQVHISHCFTVHIALLSSALYIEMQLRRLKLGWSKLN